MPNVDFRMNLGDVLSPQERMIFELTVDQLNVLRQRAGMPLLTEEQVKAAIRTYVASHPNQNWVRQK